MTQNVDQLSRYNELSPIVFFLKLSFGAEMEQSFPSFCFEVFSSKCIAQGLAALVFDGIQKAYDLYPDHVAFLKQNKRIKYDLFGQCLQIEKDYSEQLQNAELLAEQLDNYGIQLFVLKGFAISQLYPVPEHRPCCDLDCFLMRNGSSAYDEGNWISSQLGFNVKANYYKHSKIKVGSLMVENHQYCLPIKGDPRSKKLNKFLVSIIDDGKLRYIGDTKLISPSPMFNAIYVLAHAREHFFNESITLRHICDWACILRSLADAGDGFWGEWEKHCSVFGLLPFGYSMSRLANRLCGVTIPFECPNDVEVDERVLEDVLCEKEKKKGGMGRRVQLVRNQLSSHWKFREFSDRSALGFTARRVWGYLFENDLD